MKYASGGCRVVRSEMHHGQVMHTPIMFVGARLATLIAVLLLGLGWGSAQEVGNPAPDFVPGGAWLNSGPLTVESLRGKVVLVNVWVYSCYNCTRSLPTLKEWYRDFADDGFEIVGVHTPEFESDKVLENVKEALKREGVSWPVMQDNQAATWRAYRTSVWPSFYLVDREGVVRRVQQGEISSVYSQGIKLLRKALEALLAESP